MNNEKLTILYERLSHEDGRENESLSIENQKAYLEEYALRSGFKNLVHRTDDGWSGTRWDRPGFLQMTEDISRGSMGQILIKDMSRLGRNHLRVGLFDAYWHLFVTPLKMGAKKPGSRSVSLDRDTNCHPYPTNTALWKSSDSKSSLLSRQ